MSTVHHRFETIAGYRLFYREAGPVDAPTIVLLHGFPTSSYMFRDLVPALADRYHVIAPDHLGFGLSDAPTVAEFDYTFDRLADLTAGLLEKVGVTRYAIYVQDYGAPVGWRLALRDPDAVTAVVTQNGNGYDDGFVPAFWETMWAFHREETPETVAGMRAALTLEAVRWQYVHGEPDPSLVPPESWEHDVALISRPGNDEVQLSLFRDYATNPPLYPRLHDWLRERQVPVLAVWGELDEIFGPDGARAFARDTENAEVHLLRAGHFALETQLEEIATLVRDFLDRTSAARR